MRTHAPHSSCMPSSVPVAVQPSCVPPHLHPLKQVSAPGSVSLHASPPQKPSQLQAGASPSPWARQSPRWLQLRTANTAHSGDAHLLYSFF